MFLKIENSGIEQNGLSIQGPWVAAKTGLAFMLVETDDASKLYNFCSEWTDLWGTDYRTCCEFESDPRLSLMGISAVLTVGSKSRTVGRWAPFLMMETLPLPIFHYRFTCRSAVGMKKDIAITPFRSHHSSAHLNSTQPGVLTTTAAFKTHT